MEDRNFSEEELLKILEWCGFSNKRGYRGSSINGRCPIHENADNDNGFTAYLDSGKNGIFICWTKGCLSNGAHPGGDVFDLVSAAIDRDIAEAEGVLREELEEKTTFNTARAKIEEIIERAIGGNFEKSSVKYQEFLNSQFEKVLEEKRPSVKFLEEDILDRYKNFHPYMLDRGFSKEVLNEFEIGYDPITERITFPMRDIDGKLIAIARRVVDDSKVSKLNPKYKYDSFAKGEFLYNLNRVKKLIESDPEELLKLTIPGIIIVEGQVDVMRLHQLGFPLAVAVGGSSLTPHQGMLLESLTDQVTVIADKDQAGAKLEKSIKEIMGKYVTVYAARLPAPYKDVGEIDQIEGVNIVHYALETRKRL